MAKRDRNEGGGRDARLIVVVFVLLMLTMMMIVVFMMTIMLLMIMMTMTVTTNTLRTSPLTLPLSNFERAARTSPRNLTEAR